MNGTVTISIEEYRKLNAIRDAAAYCRGVLACPPKALTFTSCIERINTAISKLAEAFQS